MQLIKLLTDTTGTVMVKHMYWMYFFHAAD
jgi:hypothetical protein